jgi:hypothetical protein
MARLRLKAYDWVPDIAPDGTQSETIEVSTFLMPNPESCSMEATREPQCSAIPESLCRDESMGFTEIEWNGRVSDVPKEDVSERADSVEIELAEDAPALENIEKEEIMGLTIENKDVLFQISLLLERNLGSSREIVHTIGLCVGQKQRNNPGSSTNATSKSIICESMVGETVSTAEMS